MPVNEDDCSTVVRHVCGHVGCTILVGSSEVPYNRRLHRRTGCLMSALVYDTQVESGQDWICLNAVQAEHLP
jgi:hypothetical protein